MSAPSIWLVGCGNMGGAMLRGWLAAGIAPSDILIIDPMAKNLPKDIRIVAKAEGAAPDILLLGIKPQLLEEVAPSLTVGANTIVISILAGVERAVLAAKLPGARDYVRVMPNMPAAIGEGISAVFAPTLEAADRAQVESLVAPLGAVEWIDDEALFHAVTGVSGSGPAFVLRFIDAMAAAGVSAGLEQGLALRLALQTVAGTARLAQSTGADPADLAEMVRSPNGTTHAGLTVMDASDLAAILMQTVNAATQRSREMAEAARNA